MTLQKIIWIFPLGNESKILKNWNNIEAVGGFEGERLISLLITDPYNLVRWSTGKRANNSFSSKGRIDIENCNSSKTGTGCRLCGPGIYYLQRTYGRIFR